MPRLLSHRPWVNRLCLSPTDSVRSSPAARSPEEIQRQCRVELCPRDIVFLRFILHGRSWACHEWLIKNSSRSVESASVCTHRKKLRAECPCVCVRVKCAQYSPSRSSAGSPRPQACCCTCAGAVSLTIAAWQRGLAALASACSLSNIHTLCLQHEQRGW
jgi:hypothetical protein